MARQDLTVSVAPGAYDSEGVLVTMTAVDTVNKEQFPLTGPHIVVVENTGASPYTFTINSSPDPMYGRTKDVSAESVVAGTIRCFYVKPAGWVQSDGMCYMEGENVALEVGVIKLEG